MHSRNKAAMELIANGWSALKEVDRTMDDMFPRDARLYPLFRRAKENSELALEVDNTNTHARYWLAKMHFKYHFPGACKAIGAALLVEAANMGDAYSQYDLGCHLRIENEYVQSDQQAFYYIEKAVDQVCFLISIFVIDIGPSKFDSFFVTSTIIPLICFLPYLHPGALYLLGIVYLTGDCVKKDIDSAIWCFHKASEKGHAGAAIAYGSLLLKGAKVPESLTMLKPKRRIAEKIVNHVDLARKQFQLAANNGCDLGLKWLKKLEHDEKIEKEK